VRELRRDTERARQLIVHLDDHDAIRIERGPMQLAHRRARVQ